MAKVLILGGAGFIGYHLARYLAGRSAQEILLVDNLSRGQLDEDLQGLLGSHSAIQFRAADLADPETFNGLPVSCDAVYLLAGVVGVRNVEEDPARVLSTNLSIILNTCRWLSEAGCRRVLFASTSETYAGAVELGLTDVPTREDAPVVLREIQHPRYSYALTKLVGEAAVTHYARDCGFEAVVVRYHNVYGPRMGFDHMIPEVMERIYRRMNPLPVYGMDQTRAFCYVEDAVAASEALMRCPLNRCEIVHIGTAQEVAVRDVLMQLLGLANFHPEIEALPPRSGSVARRCPDVSKLRALTGFEPRVGLERGLALTWAWYRQALERQDQPMPLRTA
jgi:UDP-glucose 4-epimerase/UDP-glucuronate decarboxylase